MYLRMKSVCMGVTCSGVGASFCKPVLRADMAIFGLPRAAAWSFICRHRLATAVHQRQYPCVATCTAWEVQSQLTSVRSHSDLINLTVGHKVGGLGQEQCVSIIRQALSPYCMSAYHDRCVSARACRGLSSKGLTYRRNRYPRLSLLESTMFKTSITF